MSADAGGQKPGVAEPGARTGPGFSVNSSFHVLLVDDDAVTLKYVEQLLRKCSYEGQRLWLLW